MYSLCQNGCVCVCVRASICKNENENETRNSSSTVPILHTIFAIIVFVCMKELLCRHEHDVNAVHRVYTYSTRGFQCSSVSILSNFYLFSAFEMSWFCFFFLFLSFFFYFGWKSETCASNATRMCVRAYFEIIHNNNSKLEHNISLKNI